NIGLRRQVSQLNYFTEGNTPEALIGVPEQWTPDQIRQFQEYWDALLEGNLAARRHTRFVPGGLKYQPIRDVPLKDEFDEWLARVVCFAFSIPPTAFSKQTNRATAETAQGTATAEGLQVWLKGVIDRVIGQVLGCADLEFAWTDRTAPDPATQATIAAGYVGAGIKTRNEVRAELGLDPVAGGDALTTAGPVAPLPQGLAKFNPTWPTQPRREGQWATEEASAALPKITLVSDPEKTEETPGEERIDSFDAMPPRLQAAILSVPDPVRRGRLMDDEDLAETYYQYGQATQRLRQTDPNNPLLDALRPSDWLPSDEDVAEVQAAIRTVARQPKIPNTSALGIDPGKPNPENTSLDPKLYFEIIDPIIIRGRRAIDLARSYEQGIQYLYKNQPTLPREFTVIENGKPSVRVADKVVTINDENTAIEAKYVDNWELSVRNPKIL
ncbi:MAG TPA: phage portal protein, partial [Aliidongia sp.]|uniref:phage portal protein n=1 Tax=Aliidongia sp. TaxID=1914230 RepID=UPI002DDD495E